MLEQVEAWLHRLQNDAQTESADKSRAQNEARVVFDAHLSSLSAEEVQQLVVGMRQLSESGALDAPRANDWLRRMVREWAAQPSARFAAPKIASELADLYRATNESLIERHRILSWLASMPNEEAWRQMAELVATDPPLGERETVEALVPLWRSQEGPFFALFPRILDAVSHPSVAAMVLDLSNYLFRSRRLPSHPGADRVDAWTQLLGTVVERLETFEEESRRTGVRDLQLARQVIDAIALAVSLTDTLSLLEHREAMGKWYRLLALEHRRLRVEAAAALAKLEEPVGLEALQQLAAEPLVRLRVLHYADELGLTEKLPEEFRSPLAIAEAQMIVRLSEPDLFGIPPLACELLDQRTWVWPGEEEPQECFLFRYRYRSEPEDWSNIGIAGPVCHALSADLTELPTNLIYAAYAGVSVEHPDLRRVSLDQLSGAQAAQVQRAAGRLEEAGFQDPEPLSIGLIFGDWVLVVAAWRGSKRGTVLVDRQGRWQWFAQDHERGVDAETAYAIYLGCELLSQFNPDIAFHQEPSSETSGPDAN